MGTWSKVSSAATELVSLLFTFTLLHAGSEAKRSHAVHDNGTWKVVNPKRLPSWSAPLGWQKIIGRHVLGSS